MFRPLKTAINISVAVLTLSSSLTVGSLVAQSPAGSSAGHEPNWTHGVVRLGDQRDAIKSLPMTERPYRPLHFYGNTVRRVHYRGTAVPAPRDFVGASAATILRK